MISQTKRHSDKLGDNCACDNIFQWDAIFVESARQKDIHCLFDLILYVPSTISQINRDSLPGLN